RPAVHEQDHRIGAVLAADADPVVEAVDALAVGLLHAVGTGDARQVFDDRAGAGGVIGGRRLRRRGERAAAQDNGGQQSEHGAIRSRGSPIRDTTGATMVASESAAGAAARERTAAASRAATPDAGA